MSVRFDQAFWDEHYRDHRAARRGQPNPELVTEALDLAPGRALDAGCGEGADAIWLASRGWRVTAVDIAAAALRRARQHAEAAGDDVTSRIDWVQADLTTWTPREEHFDLVSAHYVHPAGSQEALVHRLAASVAPGGTLLVVGHHRSEQQAASSYAAAPDAQITAQELTACLSPDRWEIDVAEAKARTAVGHDGDEITLRDAVVRARRYP